MFNGGIIMFNGCLDKILIVGGIWYLVLDN